MSSHEETGLDHRLAVDAAPGEVVPKRVPVRGRIAQAKLFLQRRRDLPSGEVGAGLYALPVHEPRFKELRRKLQHLDQ